MTNNKQNDNGFQDVGFWKNPLVYVIAVLLTVMFVSVHFAGKQLEEANKTRPQAKIHQKQELNQDDEDYFLQMVVNPGK